jgi:hypothetical protein
MITTVQINDRATNASFAKNVVLPNEADIAALAQLYQQFKNKDNVVIPDKVSPEKLQDLYDSKVVEPAPTKAPISKAPISKAPISRDSPLLFVLDNRIVPDQVGFRDDDNPNIWLHPRDIATPERTQALHDKLLPLISIPYPSYQDDRERKFFTSAIRGILPKNPQLSDAPPTNIYPPAIKTSAFNAPLSHIVNGEPFPELLSEAELAVYRDANIIYMMLEYKLTHQNHEDNNVGGYDKLLRNTVEKLARRGNYEPTIDQLITELQDALGVTTAQFVRTAASQGVQGIANLLNIPPLQVSEFSNLMDAIKTRNFPLNDVLNWQSGREISAPNASITQIIENGKEQRIAQIIEKYSTKINEMAAVPNQINNEMLFAASLNLVPPVLREAFFEMGGHFIITKAPDLYDLINQAATGLNYQSNDNVNEAFNQIFIAGNFGTSRTDKTLVHEMYHMLFPQHISPQEAIYADNLLGRDEVRLHIFENLANQYSFAMLQGNIAEQNRIIAEFDSPEYAVNGKRFSEMLDGVSISVFFEAIYDAFDTLQLESSFFNSIGAYQSPEMRWREIMPRLGELKFVQHINNPAIIDFIVPNTTKIHDEIYLPHVQRRLDFLHENQISKFDTLINSLPNQILPTANINSLVENINNGQIIIEHPAGDDRPVSFSGLDTKHPFVGLTPSVHIDATTTQTQPLREIMTNNISL